MGRLSKAELREDSFLRFVRRVFEFSRKERIVVIFFLIITSLLSISILGLFLLHQKEERGSLQEFLKAQSRFRKIKGDDEVANLRDEFSRILSKYTITKTRPLCLLYKGLCEYRLKRWDEAIDLFNLFYERYQDHHLAPSILLLKGSCLEQKGSLISAISLYKTILKRYKDSFIAPYAEFSIGRCLRRLGKHKEARDAYRRLVSNWQGSSWEDYATVYLREE